MCGVFGTRGVLSEEVRCCVRSSLYHRGPDAQNFSIIEPWTFFHSRLAIVDLVGGTQPFETAKTCLVFNGEIYNFRSLARQFSLNTTQNSDTEVIALLYEKIGCDVFSKLQGMFAIGLFDQLSQRLLLARDRTGKKPLYWSKAPVLTFASEMKALFAAGVPKSVNNRSLLRHLKYGFVPNEETVYEHVNEALPGCYYEFNADGQFDARTEFWSYDEAQADARKSHSSLDSHLEAMNAVGESLRSAVESRLLTSDLEVGAFLSGGVDSSLICSYAAEINPNIRTFTVKTGDGFDESDVAAAIAKKLGIRNQPLGIDMSQIKEEYPRIVAAYDEPIVDESIVPTYYVSKAAKEFVTVVLTGDGGDEVFGGYRRHVIYRYFSLLVRFRILVSTLSRSLPGTSSKSSAVTFIKRLGRLLTLPRHQQYWTMTTDLFFDAPSPIEFANRDDVPLLPNIENFFDEGMSADFHGILPKILLKKVDIATMQHSLEARCPFLDTHFIETTMLVNKKLKVSGWMTKKLLRDLMQQRIGGEFSRLPKRGFEINVKTLIDETLQDLSRDCLHAPNPYYANLIDHAYVKTNYLHPGKIDESRRYKGLLALLNLELWQRSLSSK